MKRSLIFLLCIAIVYSCLEGFLKPVLAKSIFFAQGIAILYIWSPGIVALIYARAERVSLPVFVKPNRFVYFTPLVTLVIWLLAFGITVFFAPSLQENPFFANTSFLEKISRGALLFVTNYLVAFIMGIFLFVGGELYWRGYLWEKVKKMPKAIWVIALFWSLWQIPLTIFSYTPGFSSIWLNVVLMTVLNFILTPILFYFRLKGKSILAATLFYSSFIASFLYCITLFPQLEISYIAICSFIGMGLVILLSFYLKLFSDKTWKKLA